MRRCIAPLLALALLSACAQDNPVTPGDIQPQLGKTPAPTAPAVTIEEYWAIPCGQLRTDCSTSGTSWILHVVGRGPVTSVQAKAIWDYIHNGYQDYRIGVDPHAEIGGGWLQFGFFETLPTGQFHADLEWDGEAFVLQVHEHFPDLLDVYPAHDGTEPDPFGGADPFVFQLWFYTKDAQSLPGPYVQRGVMTDGVVQGVKNVGVAKPVGHPAGSYSVQSFTTYNGQSVPVEKVGIEEFAILDPTTCTYKNKGTRTNQVWVTEVNARVAARIGQEDLGKTWIEVHFEAPFGPDTLYQTPRASTPYSLDHSIFDQVYTATFPGKRLTLSLVGVLDYAFDSGRGTPELILGNPWWVYDPGLNSDAGFKTTWETVAGELGSHPVVRTTLPRPLTCQAGR